MLSVPSSPFPFECLVCLSWSTLPDLGDEIAAEIGHVCLISLCCNINSNIRSIILWYMIKFSNSCLHPWLITIRDLFILLWVFIEFFTSLSRLIFIWGFTWSLDTPRQILRTYQAEGEIWKTKHQQRSRSSPLPLRLCESNNNAMFYKIF